MTARSDWKRIAASLDRAAGWCERHHKGADCARLQRIAAETARKNAAVAA